MNDKPSCRSYGLNYKKKEVLIMNEYKNFIRSKKLHNGQIVDLLERKKRKRHNLEGTLNFLKLNPKYNDGSNARAINRLNNEIDALNELYSENSEKDL